MLDQRILRDKRDFDRLYKKGKSVADKYVVMFYLANNLDHTRVCFLASKKVGNAVARNRARRLMKEAYRLSEKPKEGYDIIFIARNTMKDQKMGPVMDSMKRVLKKAKLTQNRSEIDG